MAGSAADDARAFTEARVALRKLIDAGERGATGFAVLGESFRGGRWGAKFLRRLETSGVLRRRVGDGRTAHVFIANMPDALRALAQDDHQLAAALWPAQGEMRGERLPEAEAEQEEEQADDMEEPPEAGDQHPLAQLLEVLQANLTLTQATLENCVYLREKVDAMGKEIEKLRKAWT
jgi:hypothetical protein